MRWWSRLRAAASAAGGGGGASRPAHTGFLQHTGEMPRIITLIRHTDMIYFIDEISWNRLGIDVILYSLILQQSYITGSI